MINYTLGMESIKGIIMKIEEEKKLVAEKLMGWDVDSDGNIGLSAEYGVGFHFHVWCPNEERKWWDEIWDKMGAAMFYEYLTVYESIPQVPMEKQWRLHTAKPEICWKALIKTLEVKNGN